MSESISVQPLTSRLRALALQAGPDQNWIRQTMEDAIRIIVEQKDLLDGDDEQVVGLEKRIKTLETDEVIWDATVKAKSERIADLEDKLTKRNRQMTKNDEFYAGICCGLAIVADAGHGVLWKEIANSANFSAVYKHAKRAGSLRWSGFTKFKNVDWDESEVRTNGT
ncbi:hypothetical protein LCGC14_2335260 [marine sediment metagenome]|uniref:Uncharacterized protein n=1 Tax=marine sediment metagenome TaxID=412755 RepID=A0A0F9D143_9ZZZZ